MPRPILLLNCGSSSIKYQMIDADTELPTALGLVERIGLAEGTLRHETGGDTYVLDGVFPTHREAVAAVVRMFHEHGPNIDQALAVGHRTVHGGEAFRAPSIIDDAMIETLQELSGLAPLHNPPAIAGIEAARAVLPDVPHVGIFDTAFFADLPPAAYTYAINRDIAKEHRIRRYGFHGTSHRYVSEQAAALLGRDITDLRQIVCHLGNGASMSAIDGGKAVDTSMGLTPLEGLVMGTRSGDVDPGLHSFLGRLGYSSEAVDELLNKRSGVFGLCGLTDMRDVWKAHAQGDSDASLALDVYVHRLVHYIGAYVAVLGGVDVLTFTAGVGENDVALRARVLGRIDGLGFWLDEERNQVRSNRPRVISKEGSPVTVLVVPTNEELAMAQQVIRTISQ